MPDNKSLQQLDLNLLKVFESLFRERNMTRTAEALFLTPSAVSHAVKRLREALDDPLFVRSGNQMVPTPTCQRMAPMIIDNLGRLQQILQQWGEFSPETTKQSFTLGIHDALELSVLPPLVEALAVQAPHCSFASVKVERAQLSKALVAGQVDIALDVALPLKSPILHQPLAEDGFCVLMRSGHPLTDRLDEKTYLDAEHLSVSNRPSGSTAEDTELQQRGISRNVRGRCQNYHAARSILLHSDMLLTLPGLLADKLSAGEMQVVPVPLALRPLTTHLYWHKQTDADPALRWLRQLVSAQLMR